MALKSRTVRVGAKEHRPALSVELNEPSRPEGRLTELREHLVSASNELYLFEKRSLEAGRTVPTALRRAHTTIRAELRRSDE
jgi:hypothetical protein